MFHGVLITLCLGLIPINKFPSGGFQVVDPFIVILIIMTVFSKIDKDKILEQTKTLLPFIIWTVVINVIFFLIYNNTMNIKLLLNMIYIYLLYYAFSLWFFEIIYDKKIIFLYCGLVISVICVFTVKGWYEWEGARFSYSFNNPNQLALYCLILYATVLLLMQYKIDNDIQNNIYYIIDAVIIVVVHYLLFKAISRSALAGTIFLELVLIKKFFSKKLFIPISMIITMCAIFLIFINPTFIQDRIGARNPESLGSGFFQKRMESSVLGPLRQLEGIGILVGSGFTFGGPKNVIQKSQAIPEVHNMFGHVLWIYGIIGLLLYLYFLFNIIRQNSILRDTILIWCAILAYSVGGVVYRFRSFWVLVALMTALSCLKRSTITKNKIKDRNPTKT